MRQKIAIIGAGAKAAAIVARANVISAIRGETSVPNIVVFEKDEIGAAWSGSYDYTNGTLRLCTPGEKDVGFPYQENLPYPGDDTAIASMLHANFSWSSFLVCNGRFAEWIDRERPHPKHNVWAEYLKWVFDKAKCKPVYANVDIVRHDAGKWILGYSPREGPKRECSFDAVVFTGSGNPVRIPEEGQIPEYRVFDAKNFWPNCNRLSATSNDPTTIAVIGDGGAAGTIIARLAQSTTESQKLDILSISPMGTLFPRGDGYSERRWFSDPSNWSKLAAEDRDAILKRTESGVISSQNKQVIDQSDNIQFRSGKATKLTWDASAGELRVAVNYGIGTPELIAAHHAVIAIGFDIWSMLSIVSHPAVEELLRLKPSERREKCEAKMLPTLALPPEVDVPSGLHVPALGAFRHGPGMGNLGSLGLMAAAVLRDYIN